MLHPLRLPLLALLMLSPAVAARAAAPAPWVPDLGNGSYKNPVLHADYSDPDAIRVGEDFWLVSSSFGHAPGLPILHSRDLVNWTLVNHVFAAQAPTDHFAVPRHGQGVWAPALRHHDGKFYLYYPDPDFGIYLMFAFYSALHNLAASAANTISTYVKKLRSRRSYAPGNAANKVPDSNGTYLRCLPGLVPGSNFDAMPS